MNPDWHLQDIGWGFVEDPDWHLEDIGWEAVRDPDWHPGGYWVGYCWGA